MAVLNNRNINVLDNFRKVLLELRGRFANRSDTEHEQAFIRVGIGIIVLFYFLFIWFTGSGHDKSATAKFIYVMVGFIIAAFSFVIHIACYPSISPKRRVLAISLDIGTLTYFFFNADEHALPLYFFYLWSIFGYGFRFGRRYLIFGLILALIGFGSAVLTLPYWKKHLFLGWGLWTGMLLVSLYVNALIGRLTAALEKAEAANQAKRRFISSISHELRTPLNAIIGMTNLLQSTRLNEDQEDMLYSLNNASKVMLSLIEDVLDFSKIEAGKIVVENVDFDLYQLITNTVDVFKHQAAQRGLKLIVNIDPNVNFPLRGDPHHLRQVLVNLLSNAIKFTADGYIALRVVQLFENEFIAGLRFEVEDTGIGIAPEAQEKIFESFTQADDSTTRRYGGTGLGTTISKQLVGLMGGKIGVQSALGSGSTFWIELNLEKQEFNQQSVDLKSGLDVLLVGFNVPLDGYISSVLQQLRIPYDAVPDIEMACLMLSTRRGRKTSQVIFIHEHLLESELLMKSKIDVNFLEAAIKTLRQAAGYAMPIVLTTERKLNKEEIRKIVENSERTWLLHPISKSHLMLNILHMAELSTPSVVQHNLSTSEINAQNNHCKSGFNILVAEDNQTNRKVIQRILERAGHTCTLVQNGEEALNEIEKRQYDAIVLDMNMPVISGLEVIKVYRFMCPPTMRSPVIVFSADVTKETKEECSNAGVDAFLPKPIEIDSFLYTVNELVKKSKKDKVIPEYRTLNVVPLRIQPQHEEVILNYATLAELESIGQNTAFVDDLISGFKEDAKLLLPRLEASLLSQKYEEFKENLHAVKGSAISIGAVSLKLLCQRLEKSTHAELKRDAAIVLEDIKTAFAQLSAAFIEYKNKRFK